MQIVVHIKIMYLSLSTWWMRLCKHTVYNLHVQDVSELALIWKPSSIYLPLK